MNVLKIILIIAKLFLNLTHNINILSLIFYYFILFMFMSEPFHCGSYSLSRRVDLPSYTGWGSWLKVSADTRLQVDLLRLSYYWIQSSITGPLRPYTFQLQCSFTILFPGHFKFFILTHILSDKLNKWQSAPPPGFQPNPFFFDCNVKECLNNFKQHLRSKIQQVLLKETNVIQGEAVEYLGSYTILTIVELFYPYEICWFLQ